jgi:hypothetical protein
MSKKKALLNLLRIAGEAEQEFAVVLGDLVRHEMGSAEQWAPKDELGHIAAWKLITADTLFAGMNNEPYTFHENLDEKNEALFHQYASLTWEEIVEVLENSRSELVARVEAMPEEDLVEATKYPWLEGRSFWESALREGFCHSLWHLALMYAGREETERGHQLMEQMADRMLSLNDAAGWQNEYRYKLACYYALTGAAEKAMEILAAVLPGNPDLMESSKQDSDLASIWEEPAYRMMIGT